MITALSINTGGLGRFGNQLFTIASTIGIAVKSGQPYAFPKWINKDNELFGEKADEMSQYFVNPLPEIPQGLSFIDHGYFWDYKDVFLHAGNWNMNSHLQSVKYFDHCMDLIRYHFTMKDEIDRSEYCCLHFRAGDYIADERAYHPRCNKEYYEKAMSIVSDNGMAPVKYAIFSDDFEAWHRMFPDLEYSFEFDENYLWSFRFMKRCRDFITANSSFSHMAALLGTHPEKKIIMPKKWFGEQANGLSFDSLYPPNAILI